MESYHLCAIVVLGLMIAAISNASYCPIMREEDNGCTFYIATSNVNMACYIHIIDKESDFAVRKSNNLTEVNLDFTEIKLSARPNDKSQTTNKSTKPAIERKEIAKIIETKWTHIQAISSGGEKKGYVIGNEEFLVPNNFSRFRTFIWVKGSLHYTNDTKCFHETLNITTSQSTDTQYMTNTQSTGIHYLNFTQSTSSHYLNTTPSTTSNYIQSTPTTESATTAGPFEQWWLYVIIGVLIMIVALLAVTMAINKRRKTDVDDAITLRHKDENSSMSNDISRGPQIPDFYGNTKGGFQTASNPEEHIYEEPDLLAVPHTCENANDNGGPVTCGNETSGGHPPSQEKGPTTIRRGSAHESENSLYGCITGGEFQV